MKNTLTDDLDSYLIFMKIKDRKIFISNNCSYNSSHFLHLIFIETPAIFIYCTYFLIDQQCWAR